MQPIDGPLRRVAVFRALQLGDLVCAVPALRALRRALPQAAITLVGLPWAADFARRFAHLIDDFAAFPGFPGWPEREADVRALPSFFAAMQAARFDLVLQMHGRGESSNPIALLFAGRHAGGFHPVGGWCPDPRWFCPWPERGTEIERMLALVDFLGIERQGLHVEFPVRDDEREGAAELMTAFELPERGFVILHPGARMPSRRWPIARFASLASMLEAAGWRVAVTGSGTEEGPICEAVRRESGGDVVNLHDRTTLGTLAGLVQSARLVVCNDTGISHVAAGCGTPSVIVSCGADPTRFAPADRARHRMLFRMTECRPCMHAVCPIGHPCAVELTLDAVAQAAFSQLGGALSAAAGDLVAAEGT